MIGDDKTTVTGASLMRAEVKSMVAKLLAKEDVTIQRGDFPTASFDLKSRVLKLPLWKSITNAELDLFIGHEVSHALNTPDNAVEIFFNECPETPFSLCNVVEDIRIEKIIQAEYPGLIRSFKEGYGALYEKDFFGLGETDMADRNLIDRINIKAKLRDLVDVPFSDEEMPFVEEAFNCKTFDDVIESCKNLKQFIDENTEDEDEDENKETESSAQNDNDDSDDSHEDNDAMSSEDGEPGESLENDSGEDTTEDEDLADSKYEAESQKNLEESLNDDRAECRDEDLNTIVNFLPPKVKHMEACIVSYSDLEKAREDNFPESYIQERADKWIDFKRTNKKYIAALKREFEMKKAAHRYTHATTAKTGRLDVNKLHSYKYSEDIFSSITNLADAKNHGMLFFVDMSGSMHNDVGTIYRQAILLAMFCQSANIPFEVYGFTGGRHYNDDSVFDDLVEGMIDLSCTHIVQLLTSDLKGKKFERAIRDTWIASTMHDSYYGIPSIYEQLYSTPLSETTVVAHYIAKRFKAKYRPQHLMTMFLTDGEGHTINVKHTDYGSRYVGRLFGGKPIEFKASYGNEAEVFLKNYKEVTGSTVVHFYLTTMRDMTSNRQYRIDDSQKKAFRRDGTAVIDGQNSYDRSFIIKRSHNTLDNNESFAEKTENIDYSENATALRREFIKHSKGNKGQRIFVNKFVEAVA